MNKNKLSHWYPKLVQSGVPAPRTKIFHATREEQLGFLQALDGGKGLAAWDFADRLIDEAKVFGAPFFLRTGHTSAKHQWSSTCFVKNPDMLFMNMFHLVEYSLMQTPPLPIDEWVLRGYLRIDSTFTAFNGLPISHEWRYFIENGEVVCSHPYWPIDAIKNPSIDNWRMVLEGMHSRNFYELDKLSEKVAAEFEGAWSLDWAQTKEGVWYAIDMAQAKDSWHWLGCPNTFSLRDF